MCCTGRAARAAPSYCVQQGGEGWGRDGVCATHSGGGEGGRGRARRGDLVAYRTGKQERGRELVSHRLESIIGRRGGEGREWEG